MYYPNKSAQVKVFQCLEMRHPLADGVQRVRCYPFPKHTFQGRNIKDTVFLRPIIAGGGHFQLPRDKNKLEYGRVLLIFKMRIPGKLGRVQEVECAFIKYFDKYLAQGEIGHVLFLYCVPVVTIGNFADNDELVKEGYVRLYEPPDWYDVVPVEYVLGRLPIVPDFMTPTIPRQYRRFRNRWFRRGVADHIDKDGKLIEGSKIFYVNHFAMTWARSKKSLFRYLCVYCFVEFLLINMIGSEESFKTLGKHDWTWSAGSPQEDSLSDESVSSEELLNTSEE